MYVCICNVCIYIYIYIYLLRFISLVENGKFTFHNCENIGKYISIPQFTMLKTKIERVKRKFSPFSHFTTVKMIKIWPSTVHRGIL